MKVDLAARPRLRAAFWAFLIIAVTAAAALALADRREGPALAPRPPAERPELMLLTSLPLIFAESFTLEGGGSPALTALETRYRVVPIGVADAASLNGGALLLMAHPLAQPAEALVELDAWVRAGGRVVLLADPKLEWPSERPLGDKLRPPPSFADTGLLKHWGLELFAPTGDGDAGQLAGACPLARDGLVARCRVGRGMATIIADADFLNAAEADAPELQMLLVELARIER